MRTSIYRIVVTAVFSLSLQVLLATNYVTFNDGRLLVFPDSCVETISTYGGSLSFTALDGKVYSYSLGDITSVEQQLTKELPTILSYKFNNKYNYQVYTDAIGVIEGNEISVAVAGIGKWLTASFSLSDEAARAYVEGTEQVSKQSRLHFDTNRVYTVGYPGDAILVPQPSGGYAFMPFGRQYTVIVDFLTDHSTAVPRIDINTVGGVNITSKEVYVDAEIIIDGGGVFPSMTDSVKIRGRGNSSWTGNPNAKNPYRLKFADKVMPFGLKQGKNWVLLANLLKGSMMTNAIGMKAASLFGTEAVNHIIPVELYINGTYKGSYNFTEKVGLASNSVDLEDESAAALLELDSYYDEPAGQKYRSAPYALPVNIKKPDFDEGTTMCTLDDIRQRFNGFVTALWNDADLAGHADMDHFARFFLFNDFICNNELNHPKSTFCYYENVLDEDSKLKFGPAWDLDWAFGYDGSYSYSYFKNHVNYDYFHYSGGMTHYSFVSDLGNHHQVPIYMYPIWRDFRDNGLEELCDFCYEYYEYAKPSFNHNREALGVVFDYAAQIPKAVAWLRGRADFINEGLRLQYELLGDVNDDREVGIADVSMLIDILLSGETDAETRWRADVNKDNEITIGDLNALIDLILENQ